MGIRCELPLPNRNDGQTCALWDTHTGECLAYPQVIRWILEQLALHSGYRNLEEVSDMQAGLWVVRASFKYKAKVINRDELETEANT